MKPVKDLLFIVVLTAIFFSCRKESFTSNPGDRLQTSVESLQFDTVFTTAGSITQVVKIINPNKKGIHISSVQLMGGSSSPYKINVDGIPGPEVKQVDVPADDSIYVFVSVHIDPNASTLPFIVEDSIEINYNGNTKKVKLEAYGQNAHFFKNREITGSETWNNDLPYVILGRLTVDTNALLTINKGCRIYMHADAPFIVHGSLQVNGEKWDSTRVVFAGDRLDLPYREFPAAYPGIIFTDMSQNNIINYGIIKNAYQGIVVTDPSPAPRLTLNQTIIDNAYDAGLIGVNTNIVAKNLLVSNCGKSILLVQGGSYNFEHVTVTTVSNNFIQHKEPALVVTNFINQNNIPVTASLNAVFRNCIFWGEANGLVEDEVLVLKQGNNFFNVSFDQVLWRMTNNPQNTIVTGAINNQDPVFDSINTAERIFSFRLKENSPAINKGVLTGLALDLDGAPRPVGLPDLGAYERQ